MGAREELIEKVNKQIMPVWYKFPKTKKFGKREKMKFLIKPIISSEFLSKPFLKIALKERSNGQSIEEAARIAAEAFKESFSTMDRNSKIKLLIEKGVVYPKIVEREINIKNDEIPFSYLNMDIKVFLVKKLMAISPIAKEA